MARWVRRRDRAGRVPAVANQKEGVLVRYGLTRHQADRSAWVVDRDGRRWEGAAAINRVLATLGGWPSILAAPYRLRPLAAIEEAAYRSFAKHRASFSRFGVRPECEEPGSDCE